MNRWIAAAALAVFVVLRVGTAVAAQPRQFPDSADYLAGADYSVGQLLAGGLEEPLTSERIPRVDAPPLALIEKPPATSLLYKVTGTGSLERIVAVQAIIGAAAWSALAIAAGSVFRRRAARWVAFGGVLLVGLTPHVAPWDSAILSESVATSALAATLAAGIALGRRRTWARVAGLAAAVVVFGLARDVNTYVLLAVAVPVGVAVVARRLDRGWLIPAASALLVFAVSYHGAETGERELVASYHRITRLVLPRPDIADALVDQGMPDSPELRAHLNDGYMAVAFDPDLDTFNRWLREDGRTDYMAMVAKHPVWAVTEPLHDLHLVTDDPIEHHHGSWLLPTAVAGFAVANRDVLVLLQVAVIGATVIVTWGRRRSAAVVLLGVLVAAGMVYVLNWHGDGNDFGRHAKDALVLLGLAACGAGAVLLELRERAHRDAGTGDVGDVAGVGH